MGFRILPNSAGFKSSSSGIMGFKKGFIINYNENLQCRNLFICLCHICLNFQYLFSSWSVQFQCRRWWIRKIEGAYHRNLCEPVLWTRKETLWGSVFYFLSRWARRKACDDRRIAHCTKEVRVAIETRQQACIRYERHYWEKAALYPQNRRKWQCNLYMFCIHASWPLHNGEETSS